MIVMSLQDAVSSGKVFIHKETCPHCKRRCEIAVPYDRKSDIVKCYCGNEFEMTIQAMYVGNNKFEYF